MCKQITSPLKDQVSNDELLAYGTIQLSPNDGQV